MGAAVDDIEEPQLSKGRHRIFLLFCSSHDLLKPCQLKYYLFEHVKPAYFRKSHCTACSAATITEMISEHAALNYGNPLVDVIPWLKTFGMRMLFVHAAGGLLPDDRAAM